MNERTTNKVKGYILLAIMLDTLSSSKNDVSCLVIAEYVAMRYSADISTI